MSDLIYLYGFISGDASAPPDELEGIEDRPVELEPFEGFAAAISRVPDELYGQAALEERSQDLRWMSHRAFQHERVVTWFVDRGGIVPTRFLTIHASDDSLRREASERASTVRELLVRLAGRREWDLKVHFDREQVAGALGSSVPEIAAIEREMGEASPGRAYLMRRRRDEIARERAFEVALELASELVDELARHAERVARIPAPAGSPEKGLAARAAFLVPEDREEGLRTEADARGRALEPRGFDVRLTGPWAPYRFVSELDEGGASSSRGEEAARGVQ